MRQRHSRTARAGLAAVIVAGTLTAATLVDTGSAGADTISGALGIKSTGSTYAGLSSPGRTNDMASGAAVRVVKPGKTGVFSVQALNDGTQTAKYVLYVNPANVSPSFTWQVLHGRQDISSPVSAPGGYPTGPIDPGKTQTFTVRLTAPTGTVPLLGSINIDLGTIATGAFATVVAADVLTATHGTAANDLFVTTSGQPKVMGSTSTPLVLTSKTVKTGHSATFTVKAQNDSATSADTVLELASATDCGNFTLTAKVGSTDVTAAASTTRGYDAGVLEPHHSVTMRVTVTNTGPWPATCSYGNYHVVDVLDTAGGSTSYIQLVTNSV